MADCSHMVKQYFVKRRTTSKRCFGTVQQKANDLEPLCMPKCITWLLFSNISFILIWCICFDNGGETRNWNRVSGGTRKGSLKRFQVLLITTFLQPTMIQHALRICSSGIFKSVGLSCVAGGHQLVCRFGGPTSYAQGIRSRLAGTKELMNGFKTICSIRYEREASEGEGNK